METVRSFARWSRPGVLTSGILTGTGAVAWWASLPAIDPQSATDLGLVAVLPPAYFLGVGLVILGFMMALSERPLPTGVLLANLVAFIVMVHGLPAFVADVAHYSTTWVHVGFADVVSRTGGVLPELDARFSWPVFFALAGFIGEATGMELGRDLAPWVPLATNVLLLPSLMLIFRALSRDMRVAWVASFVFFAANWIGQDYMSPQGFAFLVYVTVLGVVLAWFTGSRQQDAVNSAVNDGSSVVLSPPTDHEPEAIPLSLQRGALVGVLIVLIAALIPSHQLTPFALLGALGALVLFRRVWLRGLPVLLAVMLGTWISYMTVPYLSGHIEGLLADVGRTQAAATENVSARLGGSAEHLVVIYLRLAATAGIWSLAGLGVLRRLHNHHWDVSAVLLAGAPVGMFFLQSYGGEMLLRIYLFSLPFVSFLVAALVFPLPGRGGKATNLALATMLAVMVVALMFTRYGNERADLMTVDELDGIDALHRLAPPGSTLVSANANSPLRYRDVEEYRYASLGDAVLTSDVDAVIDVMQRVKAPSFLIFTQGQRAWAELLLGMPDGAWDDLQAEIARSPALRLVYENPDTRIYRLAAGADD